MATVNSIFYRPESSEDFLTDYKIGTNIIQITDIGSPWVDQTNIITDDDNAAQADYYIPGQSFTPTYAIGKNSGNLGSTQEIAAAFNLGSPSTYSGSISMFSFGSITKEEVESSNFGISIVIKSYNARTVLTNTLYVSGFNHSIPDGFSITGVQIQMRFNCLFGGGGQPIAFRQQWVKTRVQYTSISPAEYIIRNPSITSTKPNVTINKL